MTGDCCASPAIQESLARCPISGGVGQPVKWTTMVALSTIPVPPRQSVSLCLDADCEVVYFGDRGLEVRGRDLHAIPGFKSSGERLVCYCFQHSRAAIEREVRALAASPTLDRIRMQVKAKNCACELRNPTGKCCLSDIQRIVEEASTDGALP